MKRSGIGRTTIRHLRPSDPDPPGEPKRYAGGGGQVRLRWKVGVREYVERYERDETGKPVRSRPMVAKRLDAAEALRLHAEGLTQAQIAQRIGGSAGSVSRLLRRFGVQTRKPTDYLTLPPEGEICRLYLEGLGEREVARRLGCATLTVRKALRAAGVRVRRPGRPVGASGATYETELRHAKVLLRERAGGLCEVKVSSACRKRGTHAHHRKLRQHGGNELSNLLLVCICCHAYIHGHPQESYEHGWLVHSWDDPEVIPVALPSE